jgi:hypothetical protein
MKARSHLFIRAATVAAMVAVAVAGCAFSPTTGTKGTMPPPFRMMTKWSVTTDET